MQVAPPANGKKLWRVKRALSVGSSSIETDLSIECLNSSLKISAAGRLALGKRPPAKRPKLKPGMPKDFVFVDLSPIKTSPEDDTTLRAIANTTPPLTDSNPLSPLSLGNYSFHGSSLDEDISQCGYDTTFQDSSMMMNDSVLFGLGLMNLGYEYPQAQPMAMDHDSFFDSLQQDNQTSYPTPELDFTVQLEETKQIHKRSKSVSFPRSNSAGGFQFKTYKGPKAIRKHARKNLRSVLDSNISFNPSAYLENISSDSLVECTSCDQFLESFLRPASEVQEIHQTGFFDLSSATVMKRTNTVNEECLQSPISFDFLATNDFFKEDLNAFCFPCV